MRRVRQLLPARELGKGNAQVSECLGVIGHWLSHDARANKLATHSFCLLHLLEELACLALGPKSDFASPRFRPRYYAPTCGAPLHQTRAKPQRFQDVAAPRAARLATWPQRCGNSLREAPNPREIPGGKGAPAVHGRKSGPRKTPRCSSKRWVRAATLRMPVSALDLPVRQFISGATLMRSSLRSGMRHCGSAWRRWKTKPCVVRCLAATCCRFFLLKANFPAENFATTSRTRSARRMVRRCSRSLPAFRPSLVSSEHAASEAGWPPESAPRLPQPLRQLAFRGAVRSRSATAAGK